MQRSAVSKSALVKRLLRISLTTAAVVVGAFAVIAACVRYLDWSADRTAKAFCDAIKPGSEIASAIEHAKGKKILYGSSGAYTFYFPGTMFNKAVCTVSVDQAGKVTSKSSEMEYD
jgi:hypothetical protein